MKQIYPKCLEDYMKSKPESVYIPRKLHPNEELKLYKRYYQVFNELYFKVIEIFSANDTQYYTIRHHDNMNSTISYPVNNTYEMMLDKNDIVNTDNIINTDISYTGAEIKFWFYSHNADFDTEKYEGFWSYISSTSKNEISDEKSYFIYAIIDENNNYKKCRFSLDKSKLRRKR